MASERADRPAYTARVGAALAYAADAHATQRRKGKDEPYLSHVLQVAALVTRYDGSEDQIIAAALHDVPEDHGGERELQRIEQLFGVDVARIVRACSDSLVEDPALKADWRTRKAEHLRQTSANRDAEVALVAAADKIANLTDLVADLQVEGDATLLRFRGGAEGTRAYYAAMLAVLAPALADRVAVHLGVLVDALGAHPVPAGTDAVAAFLQRTATWSDPRSTA